MKILFCNQNYPGMAAALASRLPAHAIVTCHPESVKDNLDSVDVVVPIGAEINGEIIRRGKLKLIQQCGVGVDSIDLEAANEAGILVANLPGLESGIGESVAELTILFMLALSRRLAEAQTAIQGRQFGNLRGISLVGKTALIIGLGSIGCSVAVRLRPFGMNLLAVREHPERGAPFETGIDRVYGNDELSQVLKHADFVILAVPANENSRHLINRETVAAMKPGSYLINVARGAVVDEDALIEGLATGRIAGAGLDVFAQEPPDPENPLFQYNVIKTPHIGGTTDISIERVAALCAENIQRYGRGEKPLYIVNSPREKVGSPVR